MFASDSSAIAGRSVRSYSLNNSSARQYSIDSQGRFVNDLGWFLCGYYGTANDKLNRPATAVTCHNETPLQTPFLTCELSGSFEIQCSVLAISYASTGFPNIPAAFVVATGT
jgi:hypothetical protein